MISFNIHTLKNRQLFAVINFAFSFFFSVLFVFHGKVKVMKVIIFGWTVPLIIQKTWICAFQYQLYQKYYSTAKAKTSKSEVSLWSVIMQTCLVSSNALGWCLLPVSQHALKHVRPFSITFQRRYWLCFGDTIRERDGHGRDQLYSTQIKAMETKHHCYI